MALTINLIKKEIINIRKREKLTLMIRTISLMVLMGFFVLGSLVLSYFYYLKNQNGTLNKKVAQEEAKVKSLAGKENQVVYLNKKLTGLASIVDLQVAQQKQVEKILSLLPEGISITGFKFSNDQQIELEGEALAFLDIQSFFGNLLKEKEANPANLQLATIFVANIKQNEAGDFSFTLILKAKEGKIES